MRKNIQRLKDLMTQPVSETEVFALVIGNMYRVPEAATENTRTKSFHGLL
jgi:hypothetical protein